MRKYATVNDVLGSMIVDVVPIDDGKSTFDKAISGIGKYDRNRRYPITFDVRGVFDLPPDDLSGTRLEYALRETIDNSLAAYGEREIDGGVSIIVTGRKGTKKNVVIILDDYAGGIPEEVKRSMEVQETVVMSAKRATGGTAGGRGYKTTLKAMERLGGIFQLEDIERNGNKGTRATITISF